MLSTTYIWTTYKRLPIAPSMRVLLCAALGMLAAAPTLHAQGFDPTVSHVTPFPEKDVYRTYILGDGMADGIAVGLADAFRDDKTVEFFKKSKVSSGFTRPDIQDWAGVVKETSAKERFHIAIVMIGAADRRPIPTTGDKKRPLLVGSEDWKLEYGRRVDEFLKAFRRSSAAIYWVGLPVMKAQNASEDMQMINALVREKVAVHGGKFIDTWNGFTDVGGQYAASGPDIAGKPKALRDNDGVHFTKDGYRKLAHFVERELRRDLTVAKAERNVPLAGSESEQRRVDPAKAAARVAQDAAGQTASGSGGQPGKGPIVASATARLATVTSRDPVAGQPEGQAQEQKADTTKVSFATGPDAAGRAETVAIEIVRPAIPAQVIAHVTRNANTAKAAPVGENVLQVLAGGTGVAISSVTTVTEIAGAARRSVPVTQTPHYKVLVKGEAMPPKSGRADDFRWPRDPSLW